VLINLISINYIKCLDALREVQKKIYKKCMSFPCKTCAAINAIKSILLAFEGREAFQLIQSWNLCK